MYSTKNIENILLAELSRNQYNSFMQNVKDSSDLSFKEIKNARNSQTFRKIFGNKQRIWIPLDVEDTSETYNLLTKNQISLAINPLKDMLFIYYLLPNIYSYNAKTMISASDKVAEQFITRYTEEEQLRMYFTGKLNYIDYSGKERKGVKIGGFITKLIDMYKKLKIDENNNDYQSIIKQISQIVNSLEKILKDFLTRKEIKKPYARFSPKFIQAYDKPLDDKSKTSNKLYVCISRYPADVAAMSTRQGWRSCQNLDKDNTGGICYDDLNWHVKYDISLGTCVAYLISGRNIKRSQQAQKYKTSLFPLLSPIARILIKPFYSNKGEVYLSIGTNPKIYGTTSNEQLFIDTVQKFLEEKQSNISGEFIIPNELYNESIDNANTIIVENGKIIGTSGYDSMMVHDPSIRDINELSIDTQSNIYNIILTNMNVEKFTVAIYNNELYDNIYQNNLKTICVSQITDSKILDCKQLDIYGTNDDYNVENQLDDTIETGLFFTQENIAYLTGYPNLDINILIDWLEYEIRNDNSYYDRMTHTTIESTKFENVNKIILHDGYIDFNSCTFKNCNIVLLSDNDKIISSQFNWCKFENCTITTDFIEYSEYTYSRDGHNTYTNVTFNISSDEIYYFYKDKFINCKFNNPKILSKVVFDQCNVNNEPYNTDGDYIIDKKIDLDSISELVLEPEMFVPYEEDE